MAESDATQKNKVFRKAFLKINFNVFLTITYGRNVNLNRRKNRLKGQPKTGHFAGVNASHLTNYSLSTLKFAHDL